MPTPQMYDKLLKQHEELRWAAFLLVNSLVRMDNLDSRQNILYNAVWDLVFDAEKPEWLDRKDDE